MKGRKRQSRINEMLEDVRKRLYELKSNTVQKSGIWDAYAKLEYAILLVKFEHNFESAGGFEFNKFDKMSKVQMLQLAIEHLEKGQKAFNKNSIKSAVDDLRKARDALKLLVLKR